ncbi:MAG: ATP-grasp domain-containing protein [Acetivibrionales bacterium]|jgi:gamma-F420-2:alpha-L-glutamate ligase|nr:ATP-grasp domain-containing protein [Clostridiaceae bacterium]
MTGWIIYTKAHAQKNEWFISEFQKCAAKKNTALELIYVEDLSFGVLDQKPFIMHNNAGDKLPGFAICRCIYPLLSKQLELMGVPVFNNYHVSSICNDKRKTHQYLAGNNIDMMDTLFLNRQYISNNSFSYPVIVKSIDGHGGNEVYYVKNQDELLAAIGKLNSDEFLMQRVASDIGTDLRVYVLGKRIIASVLRKSRHDFRSNYSLGGVPSLYNLSNEERNTVNKIISMFDFGFVGIDFVFDDGRFKLNEIEDVVGSRMLYQLTSMKSHEMYFDFIANSL